ncbi:MAG: N-acetyltransferase [Cytophagales bacterium]|nr:MAG: N-acetyltransferase [Cytophagales bacterium]
MTIRPATPADHAQLLALHRAVAQDPNGIARTPDEITDEYVASLLTIQPPNGLQLVIQNEAGELIGEIHAAKYGLHIFDHILTHLTIMVHPDWQGKGVGKALFNQFLVEVRANFPEVRRVELEARASNEASLGLYRSLGFIQEGVYRNKTRNRDGSFVDSIPMAYAVPGR